MCSSSGKMYSIDAVGLSKGSCGNVPTTAGGGGKTRELGNAVEEEIILRGEAKAESCVSVSSPRFLPSLHDLVPLSVS